MCVDAFGFRVPFGALPITRTELECYQAKIELGQCRACSFNIRGRIDQGLIGWLGQGADGSHDPIPDVELVYMIPLPSGREYPLLLKAARNYSLRQHQDVEKLPDEDRRVVEAIGVHFLDPYNKRSMRVLTEFRAQDCPAHLVSNLSKVSAVSDLNDYRALRRAWDHSVQLQLLESQATLSHVRAHQEFSNPKLSNLDQFREHCAHRIDEIPDQQSFHPAEYFRVSRAQKQKLLLDVVPKLFDIQQGERLRVRIEEGTDLPARRSAQGYDGPAEGYPLPIDHMLMDAITDLRKKERYRESVAEKKRIDPSAIEIPVHVGRHYDRPERFFSVADLPARLTEFADQKGFRRSTSIRLYDPESDQKYVEYPFDQREMLQRLIWETNFERMRPAVSNLERRIKVEEERYAISSIGKISSAILLKMFEDSYAQVEKLMRRETELEVVRRKEIPALYARLTAQGSDPETRSRLVESAKERNHLDVVHNEDRLHGAFIRLQYLFETFLSADLMRCGLRGNSIIDQQSVKLIYAIGSSGQPILELETARKGRDARSTHSELLGGRCMYAGGELILSKHDQVFHSVPAWTEFDAELRRAAPAERRWYLQELNNSTGHYRVWSNTLPFAASIIFPQLEGAGISTTRCEIVDRLAKGLHVRGTGVYRF